MSKNIVLECNDIAEINEKDYDAVILTEPYIFGDLADAIKRLGKFIKENGTIVIGTLIKKEETIPKELEEFDGNNLHTENEIYNIVLQNNYAINNPAASSGVCCFF